MYLKDKVVLVTGSTTGIGEAIARRCFAEGAKVLIHGRDEDKAKQLISTLDSDRVKVVVSDLSSPDIAVCRSLIKVAVQHFGRIDCLINNAAESPRSTIDTVDPEKFDYIIRLNLRAPLFLTQAAVHEFKKQNSGGVVVNIGTINAYCGQSDLLAYSITKGGLMTLTRNLGNALGKDKIRVNQLNVGWTLTENENRIKQKEGFPDHWESKIPKIYTPSGRLLRPDDVARHVVFWASEASAPANGVVYELEQYPVIGRNLINEIPIETLK